MNISHLFAHKKLVYSLEIFPPKQNSSLDTIYNALYGMRSVPCDFMSVTYGAGGTDTQKSKTWEIAALIKQEYKIESVAHLTCVGVTRKEIVDLLVHLKQKGIQNILALRGDLPAQGNVASDFAHASDLAAFIRSQDDFFHLSGACYPEGHTEAISLSQDVAYLAHKVESGVTHLISQLFFDNDSFYTFRNMLAQKNITVPISAGIMPLVNQKQVERIISMCGATLPKKFSRMIEKYADHPASLKQAGIVYATEQMIDLISSDVRGIHLYTMNQIDVAQKITSDIYPIVQAINSKGY